MTDFEKQFGLELSLLLARYQVTAEQCENDIRFISTTGSTIDVLLKGQVLAEIEEEMDKKGNIPIRRLVQILKQGLMFSSLLNEFEYNMVQSISMSYGKYGSKIQLTKEQVKHLEMIGQKLTI